MKIGYIGLGLMGAPCVRNLLNADYQVTIYARRPQVAEPLRKLGAHVCDSPKAVAEVSDVIFTNVSDTPDVEEVILGDNGIIQGAQSGAVVIDMSTISPIATRNIAAELKAKNIAMLDAPVSGGPQGAESGTLSIMVGGDEDVFNCMLPLLKVLGKNITYMGEQGAGQVTKACNQVIVAQTMEAIGEAFILARAAGVDPNKVRSALLGGFASSPILEVHAQRMLSDDYTPGFRAALHKKDMAIVEQTAQELGLTLPATELVMDHLNQMVDEGYADADSSVLVKVLESLNKIAIK